MVRVYGRVVRVCGRMVRVVVCVCVCVVEYVYVARVCGLKYSQVCVP